jgi:hypothetical protein
MDRIVTVRRDEIANFDEAIETCAEAVTVVPKTIPSPIISVLCSMVRIISSSTCAMTYLVYPAPRA